MSKNYIDGKSLHLAQIPAYASDITNTRGGLGGELTVPRISLEFWNSTGNDIEINGKKSDSTGKTTTTIVYERDSTISAYVKKGREGNVIYVD